MLKSEVLKHQEKLYIRTTTDDLELPIIVEDNMVDIAKKLGMQKASVRSCFSHKYNGYHKIEMEEENEEE